MPPLTTVARAAFPGEPPDLPPAQPSTEPKRRGRPRSHVPTGTWEDDDVLLAELREILRDGPRDRDADVLDAVCRLAARVLRRRLTRAQQQVVKTLLFGGRGPSGKQKDRREKPSVILRQIIGWRHGLGERDVRRMQQSLIAPQRDTGRPRPRVKMIFR